MTADPRLDILGAALADPSRARLLCTLMDGRAFTNKELAAAAGIAPQTASAHLKHLQRTGFTAALRSGRHIYHRIADERVAAVLEQLATLSPTDHLHRLSGRKRASRAELKARSCYNHIAGRLGVGLAERLLAHDVVRPVAGGVVPGARAEAVLEPLGLYPEALTARACLDWTERQMHLSGPLGTALMQVALDRGWLVRPRTGRALIVTETGYGAFERHFGLTRQQIDGMDAG